MIPAGKMLEKEMAKEELWQATVHGLAKSQTQTGACTQVSIYTVAMLLKTKMRLSIINIFVDRDSGEMDIYRVF